uniref:Uncharacterized protein n=1 Tax=Salix viminalis TaxID=40686 RepID=A0A6N2NJL0_SALVM
MVIITTGSLEEAMFI